ncbi:DUF2946 family protein [Brevundimonas sp. SL130]|uniref:DUF2946 family protein n=1 Tax=Brevundimonas sp. SL130 TaxID=2995143 RepID=UPI00226C7E9F|nr:DUF2946 family protein [Brevundimonas sp. SL130]WAC60993.1 hypothetical protein OU998_06025 [Brevundimonas sp. SL130]
MNRSGADHWSISKSLAFLAAVFALVLGTLLPFAALAAVKPGQPLVICSAEGPQTIQTGGMDGPVNKHLGAKCAACVVPLAAALPAPPPSEPAPVIRTVETVVYSPARVSPPPPARAPPRPPSTAPPHA